MLEDLLNLRFAEAANNKIDWSEALGSTTARALNRLSQGIRSQPELVFGMLLLTISTLIGPDARILSDCKIELTTNIFLFVVGLPYSGKSPAFRVYLERCLRQIEEAASTMLLYRHFTGAGLFDHIVRNRGYGTVADDEICSALMQLFGGKNGETLEFRQTLNNFWYGDAYSKVFKNGSRKCLRCSNSYFCLGGTTHPQSLCHVMAQVFALKDGLEDRLGIICAKQRGKHQWEGTEEDPVLPENWLTDMITSVFEQHRKKILYNITEEGLNIVREMRDGIDEVIASTSAQMEVNTC